MKINAKILSILVIISLLFTLGGCSAIAKRITNEAKAKISENLVEDDEDSEDTEQAEDTEEDETEPADTDTDTEDTAEEPAAITTSDGKSMDWPTKNMGDIKPVSCKISLVWTDGNTGAITFEGMERAEADEYLADFESMGFTNGMVSEDDSGVLFIKTNEAGDSIMFAYAPDGTGTITYAPADKG